MIRRRLQTLLLVPGAVVLGHLISFAAAHGGAGPLLDPLGTPVVVLACVGVPLAAVALARLLRDGSRRLYPGTHLAVQVLIYLELVEQASSPDSVVGLLASPAVWAGVAAQAAAAIVVLSLAAVAGCVGPISTWPQPRGAPAAVLMLTPSSVRAVAGPLGCGGDQCRAPPVGRAAS